MACNESVDLNAMCEMVNSSSTYMHTGLSHEAEEMELSTNTSYKSRLPSMMRFFAGRRPFTFSSQQIMTSPPKTNYNG
jgi:hypothetical protein